ncbi:MAG TPA: ABC transporter ATP-binding protein [Tepidisphaeraceae bacterium]|jgi:ABC-2 type transport system ATP-binding protein
MIAADFQALDVAGHPAPTNANAVEFRHVSRRFGGKLALDDVSLSVPAGTVLGLVGENGAGKTTLIRHVLGLLKAEAGSVRVFGMDPVREPVRVLSRIGYLSEEPDLPGWMRVHELLRYVAAFYPTWDPQYAEQLRRDFALDPMAKVKHLSKGQRARAGLLAALAYRPDLLLLDEPSSGLDPIVRRDILGAIVRTIAEQGRTVIFSSHLLTEVERISDRIAIIKTGRTLFCDSLDGIRSRHCRLTLRLDEPRTAPPEVAGALSWEGSGQEWTAVFAAPADDVRIDAAGAGAEVVEQFPLNLDEIFVAHAGGRQPVGVDR